MFLTTHALVGLTASHYLNNPLTSFSIALFLHFIFDIIPHGDDFLMERYVKNHSDKIVIRIISTDLVLLLCLILVSFMGGFKQAPEISLAAILGSVLPDLFVSLHLKTKEFFQNKKISPKSLLIRFEAYLPTTFLERHFRLHNFLHFFLKIKISFPVGLALQILVCASTLFIIFH